MRLFGLVLLVACKSAPPPLPPEHDDIPERTQSAIAPTRPPPPPLPPPPAGFATAELATIVGGELATYATQSGKLTQTGTTTLVKVDDPNEAMFVHHVGQGHWADRDHLVVRIGERAVVMITATAVTTVTIPPPARFKTPKPTGEGELSEGGADASWGGLVVTKGEAWWSECPWGLPADGFQCHGYVHARLWPTETVVVGRDHMTTRDYAWPKPTPAGFVTREVKRGQFAIGGVTCEPPRGQGTKQTIFADTEGEEIVEYHWVSVEPPRLLVIYGHPGYADVIPDRWTLHAGCTSKAVSGGASAMAGPAGLWLVGDGDHDQVVFRGAEPIGQLPRSAAVLFRPAE
jgi:hypothetical protein